MENIEYLKEKLKAQYGENLTSKILDGMHSNRKTSFRVNTLKSNNAEVEKVLKNENINYSKVPFSDIAYLVDKQDEEKIKSLSIFEEGKIYLQSLSSMLPPIILDPKEGEDILDMTAAPRRKNNSNCCANK